LTKSNNDLPCNILQNMVDTQYESDSTERNQSLKADGNKPMLELIPTSAYKSLGRVLTFGAKKYAPNTWRKVETIRYVGALLRHLCAYIDDPYGVDEESGLYHSEHLLTNAMFINDEVLRNAKKK